MSTVGQRGFRVWLGISGLLLTVLLGVSYAWLTEDDTVAADLARDRAQIERTVTLLSWVHAAQAHAVAYSLTGDTASQDAFEESVAGAVTTLAALQEVGLEAVESEREDVPVLRELVDQEFAALKRLIAASRAENLDAVREAVRARERSGVERRLRRAISRIQDREAAEIARAVERQSTLLWFEIGYGVLSLLVVVVGTRVFQWQLGSNAALLAQVEAVGRDVELLNRFSQRLQVCRDLTEAREVIAHFLARLFPGGSGAVLLIHSSRNALEVYCAWGDDSRYEAGELFAPEDCWALRQGRAHRTDADEPDLVCRHVGDAPAHSCHCFPMLAQGETLGVLSVEVSGAGSGGGDTLRDAGREQGLVETVAVQVATAIASLTLRDSLRIQSVRDPLTGLFNRRYLEETVEREQLQAQRSGQALSVILLDLDHFKEFNDTHGHQAGDHLLKTLGAFLRREIRGSDIACRYGGEEFVLVLPTAGHAEAVRRAEMLREDIAHLEVHVGGHTLGPVTASFGVATYPDAGDDWRAALGTADRRLYEAKAAGRDRVVGASGSDPAPSMRSADVAASQ